MEKFRYTPPDSFDALTMFLSKKYILSIAEAECYILKSMGHTTSEIAKIRNVGLQGTYKQVYNADYKMRTHNLKKCEECKNYNNCESINSSPVQAENCIFYDCVFYKEVKNE